jgi:molecular chaperone GrpE
MTEPTEDKTFSEKNEEKEASLAQIEKELKECQEKYLRLLADSENARKRMIKEREELTRYAIENVIIEFLHPLDSFEKALKYAESMSGEIKNWAIGFEMILSQFKQVLSDQGITEFESVGKNFDPNYHEAVEIVKTDEYSSGTIVEEFIRGYRDRERIIRPARVKVAKSPELSQDNKNEEKG